MKSNSFLSKFKIKVRESGRNYLLELFSKEAELKWFVIDASHFKVYSYAIGVKGNNEVSGLTKGPQGDAASRYECTTANWFKPS